MSRDELLVNKKRRISTKYPKTKDVHYRYGDFQEKAFNKYRIDNDLDATKTTKLIDGIISEWFEMKTIQEFQREDPDLAIQMRKHEDRTQWIDIIYDMDCDIGEMRALRGALDFMIEHRDNIKHKY